MIQGHYKLFDKVREQMFEQHMKTVSKKKAKN